MNALVDTSPYVARRERVFAAIGDDIAILPTAPEVLRNRDTGFLYRHDSHFYYLTGFAEPEAVLVMVGGNERKAILFCREKNIEREIWDGYRYGPDAARDVFVFDEALPIEKLKEELPKLMSDRSVVHTPIGMSASWDAEIAAAINAVRGMSRTGVSAPRSVTDLRALLDDMRLIKDAHEIALMRRAAQISSAAHARAMAFARPGQHEYQVEAELAHEFIRHGARTPAYNHIVASGPNACVLHYNDSNRLMQDGDLLLIDAGCEYAGYASDITRTFPVNGKFSGPQRDVYQAVLDAELACMDALKPGKSFNEYHGVAERVLSQRLLDLGLLKGSLDEVLEQKTFTKFYMHRAGHWLGMDVHDAGDYRKQGVWQTLKPGMVLTNEPGLYIRPDADVPEHFWNIGVRIEDDVLITADGNENLTAATPKAVAEVEAACKR